MPFIGILTKNSQEQFIQKNLNQELKKNSIFINEKSIENLKNVKFETILIDYNNLQKSRHMEILNKIINNAKYIIINTDINKNLKLINQICSTAITYGINKKATITVSSIEEDRILVCIQRKIENIESQEIKINIKNKEISKYIDITLGIITIMLIYNDISITDKIDII